MTKERTLRRSPSAYKLKLESRIRQSRRTEFQTTKDKMKLNQMTAKWIGIRAEVRGQTATLFKSAGFWKVNHAEPNNRNGCDYIQPVGGRSPADFKVLFTKLAKRGFRGVAFEWRDIQWKHNAGITNKQWQSRVQIG